MKQEHWLAVVIGLLIFAYVLDGVVNPLTLGLPTPYHFFIPEILVTYPFTVTSILIKSSALYITPLLLLSFTGFNKTLKGIALLIISGLFQLYALQDVASGAHAIPLEWALSLTFTGVILLFTSIIYIIMGFLQKASNAGLGSTDDFQL